VTTSATAPVRGISFDVDGTLYSPREVWLPFVLRAWNKMRVVRVGRAVREELRAREFPDGASFLAEEAKLAAERLEVSPEEARELIDDVYDRILCEALRKRGAIPDVRRALEDAVAHDVAIASVSDRRVDDKLDALGLGDLPWRAKLSADVTGSLKPSPASFLAACRAMNVAPGEAAHVGDRDDTDGAGARAAGMRFVRVDGPRDLTRAVAGLVDA
jgi:putative hydrolase of the HAD superfamily